MGGLQQRFLVVDDHAMVCTAIAALIEKSMNSPKVFTAFNAAEALAIIKHHRIEAALIDARMPGISGLALAATILKEHPSTKVIGMTSFDEDDTVIEMLRAGLHGILLKRNTAGPEIEQCLTEVLAGKNYYTPEIKIRLAQNGYDLLKPGVRFSKRESEILNLICQGQSTKQIAERLQLKDTTVEDYRKEMLKKANAQNTAELVAFALRNGLL
jgi:DNA-binding NarL/FixJ family response regulator